MRTAVNGSGTERAGAYLLAEGGPGLAPGMHLQAPIEDMLVKHMPPTATTCGEAAPTGTGGHEREIFMGYFPGCRTLKR